MVGCREVPGGEIRVELSTGRRLAVDYVVLATGYKPDMRKVPYLSGVVDRLELADGFPVLDEHFQSSLPGLFITGFPATRDFGPFFGFVRGCPEAATRVVLLETVVWCVVAIGLVIFDWRFWRGPAPAPATVQPAYGGESRVR